MTLGQKLDALIAAGTEILSSKPASKKEGRVVLKAYYPESVSIELVSIPAGNGIMYTERTEYLPARFVIGIERNGEGQNKRDLVEVTREEYSSVELGKQYRGRK